MSESNGENEDDGGLLETLVLGQNLAGRRRKEPLDVYYVRDLEPSDIAAIVEFTGSLPSEPQRGLERLRAKHHQIAQMLADGMKQVEVAAISGMTQGSVARLRNDPMFAELVAHYASNREAAYVIAHSRLAELGLSAVEALQDKVEGHMTGEGEDLSAGALMRIAEMALDRSIAPSKSSKGAPSAPSPSVNLSVSFVSPGASAEGKIIDGHAERAPVGPPTRDQD